MERIGDFFAIVWAVLRLLYWKYWGSEPRRLEKNYGPPNNPKFISAAEAAQKIKSGSVVVASDLGITGWCSAIFKAVVVSFKRVGEPQGLVVEPIAGQGDRNRGFWSIDRWAEFPGLVSMWITGHHETFYRARQAADQGRIKMFCIPQGEFSQLFAALMKGMDQFLTKVGLKTFMDPRLGPGTRLGGNTTEQFVTVTPDGNQLCYTCPWPNVAIINATTADKHGNVSVKRCALYGEKFAAVMAVKVGNPKPGIVIVQAAYYVDELASEDIYIPGHLVDYVVIRPETPQAFFYSQRHPFWALIPNSGVNSRRALEVIKWICQIAKLTPRRTLKDNVVARIVVYLMSKILKIGDDGNIGVGLAEVVAYWMRRAGLTANLKIKIESGPEGGTPAPGPFFGGMIGPTKMYESWEVFADFMKGIAFAVLGALEIDQKGNVNLSRFGKLVSQFVGPGGAMTIMHGARNLFFVMRLHNEKNGAVRFVEKVMEVTFNADEALRAGKRVFYVTDFGALELTENGLKLIARMPDWTIERIRAVLPFPIIIGQDVEVLPQTVVTGQCFQLNLEA
ncbi:MAG: CoA-transferase [Patescibacteria group bacterium]